jgi:hypothetical protein
MDKHFKDQAALKYAQDMVMDAFDDAVLNVPGKDKGERIVALVDELLPRLIDRAAEAGAVNANDDLSSAETAAYMKLLRMSIEEDRQQDCVAALLVRIKHTGEVKVAGASKGLRDEFIQKLSALLRKAVFGFVMDRSNGDACGCPACTERRAVIARAKPGAIVLTGPKAEA